ncbi:MAG: hypothetical protein V4543_06030 [Bacteroidota bacterium]
MEKSAFLSAYLRETGSPLAAEWPSDGDSSEFDRQNLKELCEAFPYFQAAHILRARQSNRTGSYEAAKAIEAAAAYSTSRSYLKSLLASNALPRFTQSAARPAATVKVKLEELEDSYNKPVTEFKQDSYNGEPAAEAEYVEALRESPDDTLNARPGASVFYEGKAVSPKPESALPDTAESTIPESSENTETTSVAPAEEPVIRFIPPVSKVHFDRAPDKSDLPAPPDTDSIIADIESNMRALVANQQSHHSDLEFMLNYQTPDYLALGRGETGYSTNTELPAPASPDPAPEPKQDPEIPEITPADPEEIPGVPNPNDIPGQEPAEIPAVEEPSENPPFQNPEEIPAVEPDIEQPFTPEASSDNAPLAEDSFSGEPADEATLAEAPVSVASAAPKLQTNFFVSETESFNQPSAIMEPKADEGFDLAAPMEIGRPAVFNNRFESGIDESTKTPEVVNAAPPVAPTAEIEEVFISTPSDNIIPAGAFTEAWTTETANPAAALESAAQTAFEQASASFEPVEKEMPAAQPAAEEKPETPVAALNPHGNFGTITDAANSANDLIDNFIRLNPSISEIRESAPSNKDLSAASTRLAAEPATENLAVILTRQGKYMKAIEIYQQLILQHPEKAAYFATQIINLTNLYLR